MLIEMHTTHSHMLIEMHTTHSHMLIETHTPPRVCHSCGTCAGTLHTGDRFQPERSSVGSEVVPVRGIMVMLRWNVGPCVHSHFC